MCLQVIKHVLFLGVQVHCEGQSPKQPEKKGTETLCKIMESKDPQNGSSRHVGLPLG